jgi:VanZ family protein
MGVIFFSSTSLASEWAEQFFGFLGKTIFDDLRPDTSSYDIIHLLTDKGFHITLFFVLAILLWRAIPAIDRKASLIIFIGLVTGALSEILQGFFPNRDPAIRDVLINAGGTVIGVACCLSVSKVQSFLPVPAQPNRPHEVSEIVTSAAVNE